MALDEILPSFIEPCLVERSDSDLPSAFDFGEYYYPPPPDSHEYPQLTLVYNGKVLNVQSDLVHASLSGISIKHYYGNCFQEISEEGEDETGQDEEDWDHEYDEGEMDDLAWFNNDNDDVITALKKDAFNDKEESTTENGSFDYREDSVAKEGQPICTLSRINYRNSFWNIHRPEMCKLTWGQKYVSAATVIDHLHEHLMSHGELCDGFHTQEERKSMLDRELDEYGRLKVLACPRELPPDEPLLNFNEERKINPRCKTRGTPQGKFVIQIKQNRFFPIKDDEEIEGKSIRRSKEEFCLTIGKYVSQPLFIPSISVHEKSYITPQLSSYAEEEVSDLFYYNWFLYGEEPFEARSAGTRSISFTETESESSNEPCPPLMLDDFCRAVGKADFSDLRCNPDF